MNLINNNKYLNSAVFIPIIYIIIKYYSGLNFTNQQKNIMDFCIVLVLLILYSKRKDVIIKNKRKCIFCIN